MFHLENQILFGTNVLTSILVKADPKLERFNGVVTSENNDDFGRYVATVFLYFTCPFGVSSLHIACTKVCVVDRDGKLTDLTVDSQFEQHFRFGVEARSWANTISHYLPLAEDLPLEDPCNVFASPKQFYEIKVGKNGSETWTNNSHFIFSIKGHTAFVIDASQRQRNALPWEKFEEKFVQLAKEIGLPLHDLFLARSL